MSEGKPVVEAKNPFIETRLFASNRWLQSRNWLSFLNCGRILDLEETLMGSSRRMGEGAAGQRSDS